MMGKPVILVRFDNGRTRRIPYSLIDWSRLTSELASHGAYDNIAQTIRIDMSKVTMIELIESD